MEAGRHKLVSCACLCACVHFAGALLCAATPIVAKKTKPNKKTKKKEKCRSGSGRRLHLNAAGRQSNE